MTRYAGIVRSNEGLRHLLGALVELEEEANACRNECSIQWYEVRNMLVCARLIAGQSLSRPENRGGFYNKDITLDQVAG